MFVLVNNLKINYEEIGNGEPLILLHGWKNDLMVWNSITLTLGSYRVIAIDLPGFGKSDFPSRPWAVKDYAEFLKAFLDKIEISKTNLIGHSFGGRVAIKFSVLFPEKVSKLVLIDSGGIRLKSVKKILALILAKLGKIFWQLPFLRKKINVVRRSFYKALQVGDYLENNSVMKDTFLKIIEEDLREEAKKIKIPTLIVWGEKDLITILKEAEILNKCISDSRLGIVKNYGHWPFIEKKGRIH